MQDPIKYVFFHFSFFISIPTIQFICNRKYKRYDKCKLHMNTHAPGTPFKSADKFVKIQKNKCITHNVYKISHGLGKYLNFSRITS